MLGLELGAIGKLAGLAAATGGMVSGGIENIELKDVADLGGKIAEAFEGEKRTRLFSSFAKRVEDEVRRAIAERARSPRNRSPEIVAQNLRHALQRFAVALEKLHVSQADFVAADLDRMKVADRLLDKLAALEPCFREGDENREARPLAHEILRRSFEVATLDKGFLDNLLSVADAELLRRTTGLVLRLDRIEEKVETGFARNDAAHAITQATLQELLVAVRGQVSPDQRASITRETLLPIVEALELAHVPEAQWPGKVMEAVGGLLAKQKEAVAPRNLGGDVDEALRSARAVAPDTERAVGILRDRRAAIREEREARARAEAALLVEEADFLGLTYRRREAIALLEEAAALDRGDPWCHFDRGDLHRQLGKSRDALAAFQAGRDVAQRIDDERGLSVAFDRLGSVQEALGNLAAALKSHQDGLVIATRLVSAEPNNSDLQRNVAVGHSQIGDLQRAQGDLPAALKSYRQCLDIRKLLASTDPENPVLLRDLSMSFDRIGQVRMSQGNLAAALRQFRAVLDITHALVRSEPEADIWQRDLAFVYDRIGDVLAAQGKLRGALSGYRKSLAIRERFAAADPENVDWQWDLSASFDRIGRICMAQTDLSAALKSYREGHAIVQRLAAADLGNTSWQIDLSRSFGQIGGVMAAQGDLPGALASYRAGLEIVEPLVLTDPGNTEWQRDFSVLLDDIGNVRLDQGDRLEALKNYQLSLAIAERLAASDTTNAEWQRDLAVSLDKIGDVQLDEGDLEGALNSRSKALAITERLASFDPGNLDWQRDLALGLEHLGDVEEAQGDFSRALKNYGAALMVTRRLAGTDPSNAKWQGDLLHVLKLIGDVQLKLGDRQGAVEAFREALALREQQAAPDDIEEQRDIIRGHAWMARFGGDPCTHWQKAHDLTARLSAEGRLQSAPGFLERMARKRDDACV